ncbi:transposase [Cucumis melo var. makuwa]|uniref:Transposase n=1 Tax=Cucumis melo var. makuwa TaxID=1194695 RepID=A0A5D3C4C6_CUCMM|nr:transposase [Cucumis melo var. makuwa]TYK06235.1 transposase [Cucumis melo var. makuwa]
MFQSAHDESCNTSNTLDTMFDDAKKSLYLGCKKFTKLLALVRLYNLKVRYGWSNTSFSKLLFIISDLLPDNNEIPTSLYVAKKTLGALELSYQKIDACPNDCCLHKKEYANSTKCPKCGLSRWKINKNSTKENSGVTFKKMWYFPIVPRLIRMFKNLENAKKLCWHAMDRKVDGIMRHPADTPSWRLIDHMWSTFGSEPRNLRLGPKQLGYDINTYLAPLIDDLKILWEEGVWCFDVYKEEYFALNRPEGCIAEAQVCEEAVQFCSDFLSGLDLIGLGSLNLRKDKQTNRPLSAGTYIRPDMQQLKQPHLHILQNTEEVLCELHEGKVVSNTIRWLAHSPNCGVMTYDGYMVNGCSYHTKSRDDRRTVQNSGIMLVATTMQVSSAKNKNPVIGDMSFYGIIEDIWETIFISRWLTLVELDILQIPSLLPHMENKSFVSDPVDPRWSVVVMPPQKDFPYKCANDDLGDMFSHYPQSQNGIQQVTLLKVGMHTIDFTVKAHGTKSVRDTNPTAGFVVDPRSKKTIIQNVGVCFRQFKYRLTTTYVLPFLDDVEKLKFSPNEYSFIDQQHWTEFVASRLKEDFKKASSSNQIDRSIVWKQARMDRKGQIPDEKTKEVVNLIVTTQNTTNAFGEEDILTRALGGKDRLGILRGVGKYVTKKKYFHSVTQQKTNEKEDEKVTSKEHDRMAKRIKELEEELLKMKEKDDCVGDLKEEPGTGSKEKSSMEGAENVNDLKDLSNDLESQKDIEDVVELNEDIKVNIVKDDEEVEGVTLEKMKGAAFWIDPLKNRIGLDVTEVVERSFNVMNKKKPNWRVVKCPKQSGVVECGYYVMRFMRDIIISRSTSIVQIVSLWVEFSVCADVLLKCCVVHHEVLLKCVVDKKVLLKCVVDYEVLLKCFADHEVLLKCVLPQSIGAMKPYLRQFIDGDKKYRIQ